MVDLKIRKCDLAVGGLGGGRWGGVGGGVGRK